MGYSRSMLQESEEFGRQDTTNGHTRTSKKRKGKRKRERGRKKKCVNYNIDDESNCTDNNHDNSVEKGGSLLTSWVQYRKRERKKR